MDPVLNPYSPGAGTPPYELAGRDDLRRDLSVTIARIMKNRSAKSLMLVGLRGVGKTVLLEQMSQDAEKQQAHIIFIEAPEKRSLPSLIAPKLRLAMLKLSNLEKAKSQAITALRAIAGFAKGMKFTFNDIEVGIDYEPETGLADNGDLEADLTALFIEVGKAAQVADTAIVLFIDELQYVDSDQFASLISALHRCSQLKLPITLVGAGLPQLRGLAGNSKSYAERLFSYPEVGPLPEQAAIDAIQKPAKSEGVEFTDEAIKEIISKTQCYAYFIQEWCSHSWNIAAKSPITKDDVIAATELTIATLDESFFRVRFDRLTPKEKGYMLAMARLGAGPHRSGDIAEKLNKTVNQVAPIRHGLIEKGMVYAPNHGDTAFTVPLFDEFMLRIMID
ncbi:ATP-binding protein [Vibrio cholerae]|uniref:ATP-binding protein n=1 Tax=Vibrio TaxID=662 RepID=UPI0014082F70|nr:MULTISPECIES: ATP-binding protein [Vibrio]MCD1171384.1 AAA family ATPase [Vibrio cholerae]MCD1189361.1 ATP-binding protein [Vibrio cholerae]QIL87050.1 ATP-binding protein [Vibrio sp. HDW18]HDZ9245467.1 ATP-binding protein [Vibrio cholerae]HDZ9467499.1 ATP-binding protein [Vibrio cholerae]